MSEATPLFSYGTLRDPQVQQALFGRRVAESPDALVGYALDWVEIADDGVVALSGASRHSILRRSGDPADRIEGAVLALTEAELALADEYEADAYVRVEEVMASGISAFVYVEASSHR